jgi:uncharacterized protein (DUF2235 family)
MPKKLVLCLDGTSNRYCRDNTNVVKLAALLDKRVTDQLLYYQPGIGTIAPPGVFSRTWKGILTRLDLAFAILLKYHVQDAYRFVMRYYEPGDQIFLFGFSRGAYTARVVAGMLCKVGLLEKGNEELVPFAWDMYIAAKNRIQSNGFRNTFARRVPIEFVGVWDTVGSVRYAGRSQHFEFTFDNPMVKKVRHAVALDERRAYFRQNLWIDPAREGQDVRQVWFAGVHCDVGGGYLESECGLSKIALKWMLDEIGGALAFHPASVAKMIPPTSSARFAAPSATAKMHEPLRGSWHLAEWIPKRVLVKQPDGTFVSQWRVPRGRWRWVAAAAEVHPSVYERARSDASYRAQVPLDPQTVKVR